LKEGGGLLLLTGTLRLPLFFNQSTLSLKYYLFLTYLIIIPYHHQTCQQNFISYFNKTKPHKIPLLSDSIYNIIIYAYLMTTNPYVATVTGLF